MGRNTTIIFTPFNTYMVKQANRTRNPTLLFWGGRWSHVPPCSFLFRQNNISTQSESAQPDVWFTALFVVCEMDFVCCELSREGGNYIKRIILLNQWLYLRRPMYLWRSFFARLRREECVFHNLKILWQTEMIYVGRIIMKLWRHILRNTITCRIKERLRIVNWWTGGNITGGASG